MDRTVITTDGQGSSLVTRPRQLHISESVWQGLAVATSCVVSYWLTTHILVHSYSISRDDDLLGGMWAAVATIFVYRFSYDESRRAALSRMLATLVSFVLCFIYLLFLPFHLWGMAVLIVIGTVFLILIGRREDTMTAAITTTVVMVVAAVSPHQAWKEPILRMIDTSIGVFVGIAAEWIT